MAWGCAPVADQGAPTTTSLDEATIDALLHAASLFDDSPTQESSRAVSDDSCFVPEETSYHGSSVLSKFLSPVDERSSASPRSTCAGSRDVRPPLSANTQDNSATAASSAAWVSSAIVSTAHADPLEGRRNGASCAMLGGDATVIPVTSRAVSPPATRAKSPPPADSEVVEGDIWSVPPTFLAEGPGTTARRSTISNHERVVDPAHPPVHPVVVHVADAPPAMKGSGRRRSSDPLSGSALQQPPPLRILVVDDDPVCVKMLVRFLIRPSGRRLVTVTTAVDGTDAVELLTQQRLRFDLILMDENMSRMNGSEATAILRAWEVAEGLSHTPLLAVTANSSEADMALYARVGANGVVRLQRLFRTPLGVAQLLTCFARGSVHGFAQKSASCLDVTHHPRAPACCAHLQVSKPVQFKTIVEDLIAFLAVRLRGILSAVSYSAWKAVQ